MFDPQSMDPFSPWKPITWNGPSLVTRILNTWCSEHKPTLTNESLMSYLKELTELAQTKQASLVTKQVSFTHHDKKHCPAYRHAFTE